MLYYSNMKTLVVHPVIFFFVLGITQIHEYQLKALLLKDKIYRKKNQRRSLLCWLAWIQKNNFITETTRWLANTWQQNHIFRKSKSYEISSTDIYVGEDLEFIIRVFSWCIPLDHEIYTIYKKTMKNITSNLIKVISNYNIYPGIKIEQAKKQPFVPKTFDFC